MSRYIDLYCYQPVELADDVWLKASSRLNRLHLGKGIAHLGWEPLAASLEKEEQPPE